ncbi:MAG TPA: hypothetical protein VL137_09360, partial [Polyangiaceae bacterium]|nr:hypothetical protein [Polyangiaceae bacterium]
EFGLHLGIASIYSAKLNGTLGGFAGLDLSALSVRLWLGYALGQTTHSNTGSAHFDWLGTREEICALSGTHRSLRLGLCGTVELGYLQAKGQSSTSISARSKGTPWLAPGLGVAVRQPLSGGPWRLEFWAGLEFPLTRERFAFRRSDGTLETIHRVPWAGWGSSIGVGYAL